MSASEFKHVGSCSSDEASANAKATLFLVSSQRRNNNLDNNSFGTQSNRSLVLDANINAILETRNFSCQQSHAGTCILNN